MGTFLFDKIVFGPVYSRRLGHSLGLNLLPTGKKICTFNCVYCECGWTDNNSGIFVSISDFEQALERKLKFMNENSETADSITFAGNGEPTLHPDFEKIVDVTIKLRNLLMKDAQIAVLSNSTNLNREDVFNALLKTDQNIMKLDAGSEEMFKIINLPNIDVTLNEIVEKLVEFKGKLTVQTLLLKGTSGKRIIDNTTDKEMTLLGNHLSKIKPHTLMLYSIARGTPLETLEVVEKIQLHKAAEFLKQFVPDTNILVY